MPLSAHCSILNNDKKHYSSIVHMGMRIMQDCADCGAACALQQQKTRMQIVTLWSSTSLTTHNESKSFCCDV